MSALSDALGAANTAGLSARAIARAAKERGHSVNHDTAARYLRGDNGIPDEATLVAFADVLNVPLRTLRAAADLPTESVEPYIPPPEASRLSRRQRRAVDEVIRAMLESGGGSGRGRSAAIRHLDAQRAASPRAARHGRAEPPAE
jgi:hypothetical protein